MTETDGDGCVGRTGIVNRQLKPANALVSISNKPCKSLQKELTSNSVKSQDRLLAAQPAVEFHMAIESVRTCESFPTLIAGSGSGPEVDRGDVLPKGSIVHRAVCARAAVPFTAPSRAVVPVLHVVLLEVPRNPRGGQVVEVDATFLPPLAGNAS